jgi:hypothetical protein
MVGYLSIAWDTDGTRHHFGLRPAAALANSSGPSPTGSIPSAANGGRMSGCFMTAMASVGFLMASCERADLRPLPSGVMIYGEDSARLDPLPPPEVPRAEVIDELYGALAHGKPPLPNGAWAMATLEVCLAIIDSARTGMPVSLRHQAGLAPKESPR